MNLKFIVISLSLIFVIISNGLENTQNENVINENISNEQTQNIIQIEEVYEDNSCVVKKIVEIDNNEKIPEIKSEIDTTEEKQEKNNQNDKETIEIEQKNIVQNTDIAQPNSKQDNAKKEIREEKNEVVVQPELKPKELTPDDLEYWCVAGGSHHVAGDGENEHGYYNTWDEAYNAFLNHTAAWSSSQYKVSCCSCGLYYFWAIQ